MGVGGGGGSRRRAGLEERESSPLMSSPDPPVPSGVCGMRHRLWARSTGGEWVAVLSDCVKCETGLVATCQQDTLQDPHPAPWGLSGRGLGRGTDTDHCPVSPSGQKMTQGPCEVPAAPHSQSH